MKELMKYLEEQKLTASGAVDRHEFDPSRVNADLGASERARMESALWRGTPEQHRYKDSSGRKGLVYFDERGRACTDLVSKISNGELIRLYELQRAKVRPGRGTGYRQPVQEASEPKAK